MNPFDSSERDPVDLEGALSELSEASSPQELARAHRSIQRRVQRKRQREPETELSRRIMEALRTRDQMRAAGASEADLAAGFEGVVRDAWVKGHEWKYYCQECSDTGLVFKTCKAGQRCPGISTRTDGPREQPGKYQRLCTRDARYEHSYGEACSCVRGARFSQRRVVSLPDEVESAARQPKKPTRFGR